MLLRSQAKQTLAASNTLRVLSHAIVMSVVCPGALGNTECGGLLALRTRWLERGWPREKGHKASKLMLSHDTSLQTALT